MSASNESRSVHNDSVGPFEWIEDGHWASRVAWPQVVTLGGISLAVLIPIFGAILLA